MAVVVKESLESLNNDRFIKALLRQPVDRTPIWIMRQAGRYLPEYRATRAQAGDFMSLCKNPDFCVEVVMQPLKRYDLDAAILFSDILTIPDAMGLELNFVKNEGPVFNKPIKNKQDIEKLPVPDPCKELKYVTDAVSAIKKELKNSLPLIGFSGSPWTLATYMVEGGSSKTFAKVKALAYQDAASMHLLLSKLTESVISYLIAQIEHGANVCMVFDTWGSALSYAGYQEFSLQYMHQIVQAIKDYCVKKNIIVPVVLFTKQGGQWLEMIANTGCDAVGIDWTVDIKSAKNLVGHKVAIQGNLDPAVLYACPDIIRQHVKQVITDYGDNTGHIFNLGHGIYPDINPEHVSVLVDAVKEFSAN